MFLVLQFLPWLILQEAPVQFNGQQLTHHLTVLLQATLCILTTASMVILLLDMTVNQIQVKYSQLSKV